MYYSSVIQNVVEYDITLFFKLFSNIHYGSAFGRFFYDFLFFYCAKDMIRV